MWDSILFKYSGRLSNIGECDCDGDCDCDCFKFLGTIVRTMLNDKILYDTLISNNGIFCKLHI